MKIAGVAIVLLLILSIFILAQKEEAHEDALISVSELKEKIENKEDIFLLDVRTESEYNGNLGHIEGAVLISIFELKDRLDELKEHKDKEIVAICGSGIRSGRATNILRNDGFNAFNMVGGMIAYRAMEKKSEEKETQEKESKEESAKEHQ
jgi:rhodanese-related sulfurtransferase